MADAEGYRATEDAAPTSEVLRSIIFNKLPLLNSPGELIPNTLYYDSQNCSVHAAEQTNFFGRDRIAFNNKNFGSTPSVHIPNVFFTNTCFVVAELEYTTVKWAAGVDRYAVFYMPQGWGFFMINNIVYYLGSSSVANIQISGLANMMYHMASCETTGKKGALIQGAGRFLSSAADWLNQDFGGGYGGSSRDNSHTVLADAAPDAFLFRNGLASNPFWDPGDTKFVTPNMVDPALALAVIPIRLPFSSMCALEKRISLDTKLLQQPIQITLSLKKASDLMDISDGALDAASVGQFQNSLRTLSFQSFQQGLSDQSLSLRNELLANPRFSVGIPFQYLQDMQFNVLPDQGGIGDTDGTSGKYFVNITSMLNADLTTIQLALLWSQDQSPGATNRFCPYKFIQMDNFELLLNGQRLHNYDNDSYPYVYLAQVIDQSWGDVLSNPYHKVAAAPEHISRTKTINMRIPIYEINFSRLRALAMEAHMMNTPRFTNQTMQIGFTVNLLSPNFDPPQWDVKNTKSTKPTLTLQTSYLYNAVFMIGQDGGQSKLVTA